MLLVDASQGIQAQTLANCYQALENDLEIVAVLNKIDLPAADPERCAAEIEHGPGPDGRRRSCTSRPRRARGSPSCSTPSWPGSRRPTGDPDGAPAGPHLRLRLRPVPGRGQLHPGDGRHPDRARTGSGSCRRAPTTRSRRSASGPRSRCRWTSSGPARSATSSPASRTSAAPGPARRSPRPPIRRPRRSTGYRDPKPMVFCGLFPIDGDELPDLRDALEKLRLNDASFTYEPESSRALGFGFRCGFLGLLHMEIVRERLEREFDLSLIATAPSVAYRAFLTNGDRGGRRQPERAARAGVARPRRRAHAAGHHPHPGRVHRHDHGAVPGPSGPRW